MKKVTLIMLLILPFIWSVSAEANITILLMNTEFFFDHRGPHGRVIGNSIDVPTEDEWRAKAEEIADVIEAEAGNFVGLVEVENEYVVNAVRDSLTNPDDWHVVFDEGRDSYTGQDVAFLTKFSPDATTITNFPDEREVYFVGDEENDTNPSKILAAEFSIENQIFYVIAAHLISRRSSNDPKRLAQATVIRRHAVMAINAGKHVIVMGDMNDTPGTPVLKRLRGLDDIWGDMIQVANDVDEEQRYTYIYRGDYNLLDYILLSPSLRDNHRAIRSDRTEIIDLGFSDHRGIVTRLKIESP